MSNINNDVTKNGLSLTTINSSDTISDFMEKCNNNFRAIVQHGGGPTGSTGSDGDPGVPTKPKVPIHVWIKGDDYEDERATSSGGYEMVNRYEDLTDVKYQEGHLIMLQNAHVYRLELEGGILKPNFILALQSYDINTIINGKSAYVHIAYANYPNDPDFVTNEELQNGNNETEPVSTFALRRTTSNSNTSDMPYMGIYTSNSELPPTNEYAYTWVRIQGTNGTDGKDGENGKDGKDGKDGQNFTGQPFTIDLDGDMSTISLNMNRTLLYSGDYCECTLHAYYGNENVKINPNEVSIDIPLSMENSGYVISTIDNITQIEKIEGDNINTVGQIEITESGKDINLRFIPDSSFTFPQTPIIFSINVETTIYDDGKSYDFNRYATLSIKGIESTFELKIVPEHRAIKLYENGKYFPINLKASVYKTEGSQRSLFNLTNTDFTLLYKNYDDNEWVPYTNDGVSTSGVSCIEFKVVKNYGSTDSENPEEIWDYEDVMVVADGKGTHYYHADLGATESMMVLTTGALKNVNGVDCAEIRDESGYSITFNPKFYDGTDELEVTSVNIEHNSGGEYYLNGSFVRDLKNNVFTVKQVPYGVDVIPMTFVVKGRYETHDEFGDIVYDDLGNIEYGYVEDTVSFNVYISTITNTYTLAPSVSIYNTSTGKDGDSIICNVYKNNTQIETEDLDSNGLSLKYVVYNSDSKSNPINYTNPIIYGNNFVASDIAIEFTLYYRNEEVVRSTVPLIKDGVDGRDGDTWQYIFCKSTIYPFDNTGISNPQNWTKDLNKSDVNSEYLGENETDFIDGSNKNWYSDHIGIDDKFKYEYQSYRKWDKTNNCWGAYMKPTLYSKYSEDGSGYSVMLSNPISVIPVGHDDWSVNENDSTQFDSTFVYLYDNTTDISAEIDKISISLPENNIYVQKGNFTTTTENNIHKVCFTPVVGEGNNKSIFDFQSNTQYKLPITITYSLDKDINGDGISDTFTTTVNWTLSPLKSLSNVEVFVDKRVVNTSISSRHNIRVGYYISSSNLPKKFIGEYVDGGYQIVLTDDINDLSSGNVSNWENATYDFVKNGQNRNCYVVLVDSDGKTIVDYVNITSINDGVSAIHLELSQDYIAIPCDQNSNVHENAGDISWKMLLYNGIELIESGIIYTFKIDDEDITSNVNIVDDKTFTITKETLKDLIKCDTNIECIATYNNASFHKILFIDLDVSPYELHLNKNVLTRDVNEGTNGKITDTDIYARVKYWDGTSGTWVNTNEGEIRLKGVNGQEDREFEIIANSSEYNRRLTIENSWLENNTVDSEFRISYYKDGEELTYETIGVINTGKNGVSPECVGTKILGYSLNADADINNESDWVDSISLLNPSPITGQVIYILNEYTWSDNNKTKGVSTTLAGTQGADGKSRVLFYLGSFQDGTLEGSEINGVLNNERCDYYVDKDGHAWMRTGITTDAIGCADPNDDENHYSNWKESELVGFLQAGAIHADMINTDSIKTGSAFVDKLFSQEITANNLKVTEANIEGKLSANCIDASELTVNAAKVKGKFTANQIDASELTVNAAKIEGKLSANQIDVAKLSVNKLNTKPENNKDNISICENYIYCLNGDGRRNLKISSDDINIGCLDALFTPVNSVDTTIYVAIDEWNNTNSKYLNKNIVLSGQGTVYVNNDNTTDPVNYNGTCKPIGYILKDTKFDITIKISLSLYVDYWGSTNPNPTYNKISADKWGITSGTTQGWGKLPVGSSALTGSNLTGGYLLLYKKDENGIYVLVKLYSLSGEWGIEDSGSVTFNPNTYSGTGNYRTKHVTDIQIPEDGEYGVELYFEPNSIYYTNATNPKNIYLNTRFIINVNRPEQYTEIGKNGLISYNIDTAIALNSDGVIMKAKNVENGNYNFYGLKVNKSGIYIGTNTTNWKQLNLDKMINLGIIEDIPE